jgi:hypothetical protein
MKKTTRLFSIPFIFMLMFLFLPRVVRAEYMLPYPSYMPGNKLYTVSRIIDSFNSFWYFGNIAQIKYYLGLSDKYLVEAKTLMEYKQYLLASDALKRSDIQFTQLPEYFRKAEEKRIDTGQLKQLVQDSFSKHKEVEASFTWTPEKERPTELPLRQMIDDSIKEKESIVAEIIGN